MKNILFCSCCMVNILRLSQGSHVIMNLRGKVSHGILILDFPGLHINENFVLQVRNDLNRLAKIPNFEDNI